MSGLRGSELSKLQNLELSDFCAGRSHWIKHSLIGPPLRPGTLGTIGRYELLRVLGEGGMGVVFCGRNLDSRAKVAIKVLKPSLAMDERARAFFDKEMRHLQNLVHPNIVPVLELGEGPHSGYLVMPLMEKGNLRNLLGLKQRLETKAVIRIAYQIAAALEFAHVNGIIHRDVKPQNVLLDGEFQAYLSDFGLSLSLCNDALVEVAGRHVEGTLAYLSPTRASGKTEDTRGDIYSFGAVLYEMLTGCPPYQGATKYDVLFQIMSGPPMPIKVRCPDALPGLVQIAETAMARNLRERYPQMSFIMEDLNRLDRENRSWRGKTPDTIDSAPFMDHADSHPFLITQASFI